VLTSDLVEARPRGDRLVLVPLSPDRRIGAVAFAAEYIERVTAGVGRTRAEVAEALDDLPVPARSRRLAAGLRKLLDDRCTWEAEPGLEPRRLREVVFEAAGTARAELGSGEVLDRDLVLEAAANELEMSPTELDRRLFGDLKAAWRLIEAAPVTAEALVEAWEVGQGQAVLLRAVGVTVEVRAAHAGAYRALFHKLKFLRLLHTLHRNADGSYRIVVDGPASLFGPTTKYGVRLAQLIPALNDTGAWSLEASVRWGKARRPLGFAWSGGTESPSAESGADLPEEVATLLERLKKAETPWSVRRARRILELPGVGLCVPDLRFTHPDGRTVYLEVMGYWSRAAVWRRVELVEGGLPFRVVFAVSRRLRVSEQVLGDELPGALYVYKGVMIASGVLEAVERA
jgi:predicted nuclease of restriction endonuclease-like RecB superfamily